MPESPYLTYIPDKSSVDGVKEFKTARDIFGSKLRKGYATKLGVSLGSGGQVHHAIELQVLAKYKGVYSVAELNNFANMRGIPAELNTEGKLDKLRGQKQLHNSFIRYEWDRLYKMLDAEIVAKKLAPGSASYNGLVRTWLKDGAAQIDYLVGNFFSESKIKYYSSSLKKITTLTAAVAPISDKVPPTFLDDPMLHSGEPQAAKIIPPAKTTAPTKPVTPPAAVRPKTPPSPATKTAVTKPTPVAPPRILTDEPSPAKAVRSPVVEPPIKSESRLTTDSRGVPQRALAVAAKPTTTPVSNYINISPPETGMLKAKAANLKKPADLFRLPKFIKSARVKALATSLGKIGSGMLSSFLLGKIREYFKAIISEGKTNFDSDYPHPSIMRGTYFEDFQTDDNYHSNIKWLEDHVVWSIALLGWDIASLDSVQAAFVTQQIKDTRGKLKSIVFYYENEQLLRDEIDANLAMIEKSGIGKEVGSRAGMLRALWDDMTEAMKIWVDPFNVLLDIWQTFRVLYYEMLTFNDLIVDRESQYTKEMARLEEHQNKYSDKITKYMGYLNDYFE